MSEIDIQNAKQIRDPMDVLIEMELASDDVTLSYSGYSGTAKVADGELDEPTWPMRKLADLQGDGFPLDGSCVLYDSSTSPSQANGKLGVRGNVGEAVTITITGNKSIASLFIFATGAESVTFGSTTTPIYNNVVTIPVGATSITITLNPASETTRIEVSQIEAGAKFRITNENLIKATVSLRSDLSIIDPTLPESEINIEAYQDTDISEAVASIPEDTPIMYSAGYEGDMSPVRRFYVTGQVTWADNVLSIQGVDAVHFLDVPMTPMYMRFERSPIDIVRVLRAYIQMLLEQSTGTGDIDGRVQNPLNRGPFYSTTTEMVVAPTGITVREALAEALNIIRLRNIPSQYTVDARDNFVLDYIDAGRPKFYTDPAYQNEWNIYEEDCGNLKKNVDRTLRGINYTRNLCVSGNVTSGFPFDDGIPVGTAKVLKNNGVFITLEDYVYCFFPGIKRAEVPNPYDRPITPLIPVADYVTYAWNPYFMNQLDNVAAATPLITGETKNAELSEWATEGPSNRQPLYTQVIPWTVIYPTEDDYYRWKGLSNMWAGLVVAGKIEPDAEQYEVTLFGYKISIEESAITVGAGEGVPLAKMAAKLMGRAFFWNSNETVGPEAFPKYGVEQLLNRSPITGSFTWKGDPRMQPRDVVEWERLDGTTTTITLENITLTHEGGGTSAEITYREGVV